MTVYGTGGRHMLGFSDYGFDVSLHDQKEFAEQLAKLQVQDLSRKKNPGQKFASIAGNRYSDLSTEYFS